MTVHCELGLVFITFHTVKFKQLWCFVFHCRKPLITSRISPLPCASHSPIRMMGLDLKSLQHKFTSSCGWWACSSPATISQFIRSPICQDVHSTRCRKNPSVALVLFFWLHLIHISNSLILIVYVKHVWYLSFGSRSGSVCQREVDKKEREATGSELFHRFCFDTLNKQRWHIA